VFFAVDNDRGDLLVKEDEYRGQQRRKYTDEYHPPRINRHRVDDPASEANNATTTQLTDLTE